MEAFFFVGSGDCGPVVVAKASERYSAKGGSFVMGRGQRILDQVNGGNEINTGNLPCKLGASNKKGKED